MAPLMQLQQIQPNPLPPVGPQPNFVAIEEHIHGLRQELGRFPNLPGVAIQQQLQQLDNNIQLVISGLNQLTLAVQAYTATIQNSLDRIPLQMYNATASYEAPLRYPPHTSPGNVHPRTKKELASITLENITATLNAMDLAFPAGANLAVRRQTLMDYLGTGMLA